MSINKIYLTGSSGLLGGAILKTLKRNNFVVDDLRVDIRDKKALSDYIEKIKPDMIIHTAAVTDVLKCENDKKYCSDVNALGTKNLCEISDKLSIPIFYISTVSVFNGIEGNYLENDLTDPVNHYNLTKLEGENYVLKYRLGLVIRLNLIGIKDKDNLGNSFIEWILKKVVKNEDINLFTDVLINPLSNYLYHMLRYKG